MHILELIQLQQYCNETEIAMILRSNKKFVGLVIMATLRNPTWKATILNKTVEKIAYLGSIIFF